MRSILIRYAFSRLCGDNRPMPASAHPASGQPQLVFLIGPAAVGKMTVGLELSRRTGLRLVHNHMTIDLVLPFFEFGAAPFQRLVTDFRRQIVEEVAASTLPGLLFTSVCAFTTPKTLSPSRDMRNISVSRDFLWPSSNWMRHRTSGFEETGRS